MLVFYDIYSHNILDFSNLGQGSGTSYNQVNINKIKEKNFLSPSQFSIIKRNKKIEISICFLSILKLNVIDSDMTTKER
jgi:hypothetical protein